MDLTHSAILNLKILTVVPAASLIFHPHPPAECTFYFTSTWHLKWIGFHLNQLAELLDRFTLGNFLFIIYFYFIYLLCFLLSKKSIKLYQLILPLALLLEGKKTLKIKPRMLWNTFYESLKSELSLD